MDEREFDQMAAQAVAAAREIVAENAATKAAMSEIAVETAMTEVAIEAIMAKFAMGANSLEEILSTEVGTDMDIKRKMIRQFIHNNPQLAVQTIKKWLKGGVTGGRDNEQ